MGKAKRCRGSKQSISDFKAGFKEIQEEGQGIWDVSIYFPEHVLNLTLSPSEQDAHILELMALGLRGLSERGDLGYPCLLCGLVVTSETLAALVIARAHHDRPTKAFFNAICEACGDGQSEDLVMRKVTDHYRKALDTRTILPHSTAGHA